MLSYVDPYASSACEMVTEMIQYVDDGIKLRAFEADALYAGISIDTDGFNSKSGPRTFEAAAFLRRHGADVTRVRKMLRNDMNEYKAIASAVSKSEVYKNAFAITVFDGTGLESPTIGGAKAANQLLDISGIKASFVITAYEDKLYISARSIDEVNVQLVMEKLGGGGHMSIAGAQLTDCTIEQAVNTIKLTLDKMLEEVILLEDVRTLGKKGQIVKINDGYARNYVLPKKLGIEATPKNLNDLKLQKKREEKEAAEELARAKELAASIEDKSVTLSMKTGEGGKTFGTISTKEIAVAAKEQLGLEVDKKKMKLDEPIKTLGTHIVALKLHKDVTARLTVKVVEK